MEFASPILKQQGSNSYAVVYGEDKGVVAEFISQPVLQEAESEKEGRPIYKEVAFLSIHFPGDKTKHVMRPVIMDTNEYRPSDPERFPRQWDAFKSQHEQVASGTSVLEWSPLSKSQAMELKGLRIHTVEQLASLPDSSITFLGGQSLRAKAQAWLENSKGSGEITKLVAENEALRADMEIMKQTLANLGAVKEEPAKRGRPAKIQTNEE